MAQAPRLDDLAIPAIAGHDADSVPQEGIQGHPDVNVFAAAQQASRFLITQDLDFSDVPKFAPGSHHGILLARLSAPGRACNCSPTAPNRNSPYLRTQCP